MTEKRTMDGMIEIGVYDGRGERKASKPMTIAEAAERYGYEIPTEQAPIIVREGPRAWFVVQTTVRGEHKAQEALSGIGYMTFLPMMRKDVFHRRNKRWVPRELLLFHRYLFVELPADPQQWAPIYKVEEIAGVLGSSGHPRPIKEEVVRRFMSSQQALEFDDTREAKIRRKEIGRNKRETTAMRFAKGSRMRALGGPFGGFSGRVVSVTGRGTVKAMLELFGGLTLVEFAAEGIEPA